MGRNHKGQIKLNVATRECIRKDRSCHVVQSFLRWDITVCEAKMGKGSGTLLVMLYKDIAKTWDTWN